MRRKIVKFGCPAPDQFCADGVICYGNRIVKKGNRVKFGGFWWQDDGLAPYLGYYVTIRPDDYYFTAIEVFDIDRPMNLICKIDHSTISKKLA